MGPNHPSTINALQSLSTLLIDLGRGAEAEDLIKCALCCPKYGPSLLLAVTFSASDGAPSAELLSDQ